MKCDKCEEKIPQGDEMVLKGMTICEDCYMDIVSPVWICSTWAQYIARGYRGEKSAGDSLNETQKMIIEYYGKPAISLWRSGST